MSDEADRVTDVTRDTTVVATGTAWLTSVFARPVITAVLASYLAQVQRLEDALWSILALSLDDETGDALDQDGALVVAPRGQLDDAQYRRVIRGAILANRSSGTVDELLGVAHAMEGSYPAVTEYQPAALVIEPAAPWASGGGAAFELLSRAHTAGVGLQVIDPGEDSVFRFAAGDELPEDNDAGWGDADLTTGARDEGVGGELAGVWT